MPSTTYNFDKIFSPAATTEDVYEGVAKRIVLSAMEGFNGTIFAYGQTSSGKTHTMMGTETEPGVIPCAVDEVFRYIDEAEAMEFLLRVSCMEVMLLSSHSQHHSKIKKICAILLKVSNS